VDELNSLLGVLESLGLESFEITNVLLHEVSEVVLGGRVSHHLTVLSSKYFLIGRVDNWSHVS
jgi:hypothetical protein